MKSKPAFPLITFIKMNLVYIISYILFVIILVYFIPLGLKRNLDTRKKVDKLGREIEALVERDQIIEGYMRYDVKTLYKEILSRLPNSEDYFSIFNAIDALGKESGVIFEDNTSPFEEKGDNSVVISLSSSGDREDLKRLLELHHFKSGRFMSIDDIKWSPENNSIILKIIYYSSLQKGKIKSPTAVDERFIESVISELSKVPDTPSMEEEPTSAVEYDTTTNPFIKL